MIEVLGPRRGGSGSRSINYEKELNPEQFAAVMHPGGPMLVLAGAGSGKTRTLVYRVCRLIEDGVPPARILLLTFTNKAAKEMMGRAEKNLEHSMGRISGGTFHSAGHRILRRYAEKLGYSTRFSIMDREDSCDLMASATTSLAEELILKKRFPRARMLLNLYSMIINTGRDLEEVLSIHAPQYLDRGGEISSVFRNYLERKRKADLMDFDDLLLNWLLLLTRFPKVRRELAQSFDHILIDEYQDTNRLQADISEAMLTQQRNLMVVGDDAQSIYGFRGADFENILGFPSRHPDCRTFRLESNYRSTPEILSLANASIARNLRQFPKRLRAIRPGGEKPQFVTVDSPEEQASRVCDRVLQLRDEGTDLEEMAVLFRNHRHSMELQVELTRRNIPFRVRSGLRFFEQAHIKDLLAHLRSVDNPRDEISVSRMIKLRDGFGVRLAARLCEAIEGPDPLRRLLETPAARYKFPKTASSSLEKTIKLIRALAMDRFRSAPGESIRLTLSEFYAQWLRDHLDHAAGRLEDLEQLAIYADTYPDIGSFLAEITLLNDLSGENTIGGPPEEQLTLSTIHQAKGLEWRAVFVLWLTEGRFPGPRSDDEEEERRLFYVAVTRAKDRLELLHPLMARDRYQVDLILDPSRFILELPEDLLEEIRLQAAAPDEVPALEQGRYTLPGFLDPDPEKTN